MDLLDRLLDHDAWTTCQLLLVCRNLDEDDWRRRFDIGPGSLQDTFTHIIGTMEYWTDRIGERPARRYVGSAQKTLAVATLIEQLAAAAGGLREVSREVIDSGRIDEIMELTYEDQAYRFTRGSAIAHVITHAMHHRAQIINMLRRLGVEHEIEGDALSWEIESGLVAQDSLES